MTVADEPKGSCGITSSTQFAQSERGTETTSGGDADRGGAATTRDGRIMKTNEVRSFLTVFLLGSALLLETDTRAVFPDRARAKGVGSIGAMDPPQRPPDRRREGPSAATDREGVRLRSEATGR